MSRPAALVPWSPAREAIWWADADDPTFVRYWTARRGVGGWLGAVADHAAEHSIGRVMLTGARVPSRSEILAGAPAGWSHGAHWLDHELPVARYVSPTGHRVSVCRAAGWFGPGTYTAAQAATAWDVLADVYARHVPGGRLFATPGATGLDAWLRSIPPAADVPAQVPEDVAELIRATSPQHRIERFRPPAGGGGRVPVWYADGRFMYAALLRELGTAPVHRLTAAQIAYLHKVGGRRADYARARLRVRFTVPPDWGHVGILMAPLDETSGACCPRSVHATTPHAWHAPHAPGWSGETWADAAEVDTARRHGWHVEPLEGLYFSAGDPLTTWGARLARARTAVPTLPAGVPGMVRAALRAILLHTIGAWHSTGRDELTVTASPMRPPAGTGWTPPEQAGPELFVWRRRVPLAGRAAMMTHPEWSAQIWGRAHARILDSPTGTKDVRAGALHLPPADVIALYGDAVLTAADPAWPDDGRSGRLRIKGHLCAARWPDTAGARDQLARAAEAAGTHCEETHDR